MYSLLRLSLFCLAILIFPMCGCSYRPVNTPDLRNDSRIRLIDPNTNNAPFVIEQSEVSDPNTDKTQVVSSLEWKPVGISPIRKNDRTFSAKYESLGFHLFSNVIIPVKMPSGQTYPAVLDTGCAFQVYINDAVAKDCGLAVFPGGKYPETGSLYGLCEIPSMEFARIRIMNPMCYYDQREWQFKVLGVPLYRRKNVLIGLDLMRAFAYILFENVKQEVVFGLHDVFKPDDPSQWVSHPFVLEKIRDERRMMIDISLNGSTIHVQFDTGGSKPGLILTDTAWRRLKDSVEGRGKAAMHQSYQYGWLPCHRFVLPEVHIGQITLRDTKVDVLPDDSPLAKDFDGILSLDYFKKTSVVLDFKQNLIWINKF